jgi:hypothetical protein
MPAPPSSPPPPPPRPPLRRLVGPVREFLEDGSEVTGIADRDLILRAVNSAFRTEQALGGLAREVADLARIVRGPRPPQPSIPEVAQALVDAVEEITDHGQHRAPKKTDSDPVRGVVKRVLDDAELEVRRARQKRILDVLQQGAGVVAGAGLLELARLIFLGHW